MLLGAAMEPRFVTGRVEVERAVSYFRSSITGQGMEQASVCPCGGGIQVLVVF